MVSTRSAYKANQVLFGENKVQEITSKFEQIDSVRWHMIGHLQTNKVKYIIDKVELIHSVDSVKIYFYLYLSVSHTIKPFFFNFSIKIVAVIFDIKAKPATAT